MRKSQDLNIAVVTQLMAAQSMFNIFPNNEKLCEFACCALQELSAIDTCCVHLRDADKIFGSACQDAERFFVSVKASPDKQSHPKLDLPEKDHLRTFTLQTSERIYGYLMISYNSKSLFANQEAVVNNFTNMLAIDLERRRQKETLNKHQEHLETMVKSRTSDLLLEIAERKQIEKSYRESEEKFRTIIKTSTDGFWIVDLKGRFLEVNDAYVQMSGYGRDELLKMGISDIEVEESHKDILLNIETVKKEKSGRFERIHRRKDGSTFHVDISTQHQEFGGGRLVVFLRDITEYKKQNYLLEKAQELGLIGTWELDLVKNKLYWTDENCRIFGVPPGSVVDYEVFLSKVHPDDREYVNSEWAASVAGKPYDIEHRLIVGGKTTWVREKADIEFDNDGAAISAIGFTQDITRFKELEQEKVEFETKILQTQKLESLGILAGGIAHDFNNILMSILGYSDLALLEINPHSTAKGYVQSINNSTRKAAELVKQMLAYSGKGKFSLEPIDLNFLINDTIQMLKISISKNVLLKFNLSTKPTFIDGDPSQIRQIIMNLVINASEAVGKKSGVIALTTGAMYCDREYIEETGFEDYVVNKEPLTEGMYAFLEVSDTGDGIPGEILEKIFEPFFTTKFTGRGLGLSAVLGIMRGHFGLVQIHTEPSKGTTFKILFPQRVEVEGTESGFNDPLHATEKGQGQGTILIADDEEDIRSVSKHMLNRLGFDVLLAEDGNEAIEQFKKHSDKITGILLDLTMPHKDGTEVFREVRQLSPDIKVILSSGYNEKEATQQFIGKGLAGFIQKPYSISDLAEKIKEVMGRD